MHDTIKVGSNVFLSGQDRHVVVWSLQNGVEERRINTGLVVALVVTGGLVITAGSLQVTYTQSQFNFN